MAEFRDFFGGFIIMVVFCLLGIVMAFMGGLTLDQTTTHFASSGIAEGLPSAWDVSMGRVDLMKNIFFWGCRLLPILGILIFFVTIVKKTRYDRIYGY